MILITVPHAAPGEGQDEGATRFVYLLEDALRQSGSSSPSLREVSLVFSTSISGCREE